MVRRAVVARGAEVVLTHLGRIVETNGLGVVAHGSNDLLDAGHSSMIPIMVHDINAGESPGVNGIQAVADLRPHDSDKLLLLITPRQLMLGISSSPLDKL